MTNTRTWPISLAGMIVGLVCLTGCGSEQVETPSLEAEPSNRVLVQSDLGPQSEDDIVAAEVGETHIYVSDVIREAADREFVEDASLLTPVDAAFQQVLTELIEQRLLALEARRQGLDELDEAVRRLAAAEERILGNVLVETAVARSVSEEAIQRVYEEQIRLTPPTQEIRARHILVSTREDADEVVRLLNEGEDFATLAAQLSEDPATRFEDGDLGYFTRESILPEFADVAFSTSTGEVSDPFQTEFGWHVLTVVNRRNQPRPGLEEMRPRIVRFLTLEGIQLLLEDIGETYPVSRMDVPTEAINLDEDTSEDTSQDDNPADGSPD